MHLKSAELPTVATGCQYRAVMVAVRVLERCSSPLASCVEGAQSCVPVRLCQCIISWPAVSPTYRCETVARCQKQECLASAGASPLTASSMFRLRPCLPFLKAVSGKNQSQTVWNLPESKQRFSSVLSAEGRHNILSCFQIYRSSCLPVVLKALNDKGGVYPCVNAGLWSVYFFFLKEP